ncbi:NAD(P)/FAD-dependent oxidoreductase [Gallaecimonas mangrovi]|uniref:NAD(P)/FAD-dependent oxidoreductase n=1 Tax=Gallaecimonas mangrovi TaxID=2291597 RepID=UPI000E2001D7|nr:FAD-binding oxidoreductase [Gallaecimonas mangrovi]
MPSVAIIGGGIVGRCCGYFLQRQGMDVTVLDNDPELNAASWNNAGHIATEQVTPLASFAAIKSAPKRLFRVGGALDFDFSTPGIGGWIWRYLKASTPGNFAKGKAALTELVIDAATHWQALAAELNSAQPQYQQQGHWVLWESPKSSEKSRAAWQGADIGKATFTDLEASQLSHIEQQLSEPMHAGIAFSGTGQIIRHKTLAAELKAAFIAAGGRWRELAVGKLRLREGRAVIDGFESFDQILVCGGAASAKVLADIHPGVPLLAERGYHIEADWDPARWPAELPPVVFEDRSLIVTRFENRLRACSFVELSSLDAKPDPRKWQQLLRHSAELGLPLTDNISQWHGARPTLPDYLPAMGQSDKANNLYYAFGHQHLGLTLAPVTGKLMAQLMGDKKLSQSLTAFSLSRFGC